MPLQLSPCSKNTLTSGLTHNCRSTRPVGCSLNVCTHTQAQRRLQRSVCSWHGGETMMIYWDCAGVISSLLSQPTSCFLSCCHGDSFKPASLYEYEQKQIKLLAFSLHVLTSLTNVTWLESACCEGEGKEC